MLPKNKLVYGSNVESSAARSYGSNIQPQNGTGTYNPGDTITINIPTRNNLVLVPEESVLKFTVTYKAGAADDIIRLDSCGAHGIIERIRVWHGSNLLEDITAYGVLAKMMFDLQVPTDATYGKHNILSGTRNDLVVALPKLVAADMNVDSAGTAKLAYAKFSALQVNSGIRISGDALMGQNATKDQTFAINLISLVGSLGSARYFPLFACTSAPLRVEITLASSALATAACAVATTMTVTNCEYIAQFIELNDTAMSIISNSQQGQPIQYVFQDYRNYQYTAALPNSSTIVTMPIPAKFASLKSIFVCARDSSNIAKETYFPYSCNKYGLSSYFFRVGANILPSKVPDSVPEMFAEVCKAIASISDLNHHPSIELASYSVDVAAVNNDAMNSLGTATMNSSTVNSGSFYVALDLENYANSDKSQIFAGWNSSTDDIYYIGTFYASAAVTARFDAFALFDSLLVFENNTCYVKY